jgi:hypothetical protein
VQGELRVIQRGVDPGFEFVTIGHSVSVPLNQPHSQGSAESAREDWLNLATRTGILSGRPGYR